MPKRRRIFLIGTGLFVMAAVVVGIYLSHVHRMPRYAVRQLQAGGQTVQLLVADTDAKRELGLGQRNTMPRNQGMVFTFDQPQQLCFWMKDMHFPLDMLWLDTSQRVVQLRAGITPDSYPTTYCSPADEPASYVVELNSGVARQLGIQQGQRLRF